MLHIIFYTILSRKESKLVTIRGAIWATVMLGSLRGMCHMVLVKDDITETR